MFVCVVDVSLKEPFLNYIDTIVEAFVQLAIELNVGNCSTIHYILCGMVQSQTSKQREFYLKWWDSVKKQQQQQHISRIFKRLGGE